MNLDEVVARAIPIYDKDCAEGKCEKDCRLSVDYKQRMRQWLKNKFIEYAEVEKASFVQKLNYDKK